MLTKIVNGIEVKCSADEEAAILAEWDENDPSKKVAVQKPITISDLDARLKALEAKATPIVGK